MTICSATDDQHSLLSASSYVKLQLISILTFAFQKQFQTQAVIKISFFDMNIQYIPQYSNKLSLLNCLELLRHLQQRFIESPEHNEMPRVELSKP